MLQSEVLIRLAGEMTLAPNQQLFPFSLTGSAFRMSASDFQPDLNQG
jgi:hypothetical protein